MAEPRWTHVLIHSPQHGYREEHIGVVNELPDVAAEYMRGLGYQVDPGPTPDSIIVKDTPSAQRQRGRNRGKRPTGRYAIMRCTGAEHLAIARNPRHPGWYAYDYEAREVPVKADGRRAYFTTRRDADDWLASHCVDAVQPGGRTATRAARRRGER